MKVSTNWINSWLSRTISDRDIVEALERGGIEVEQFTSSKTLDKKIVVALVKKVVQHPGADRLKIASVTTGGDEIQVVCGAPNVRENLVVALAQVGAILPDGSQIKASKLRGEMSYGMLCSAQELGLGDDHDGLLELRTNLVLNTPINSLYPADGNIDLKTPANRFDVQSIVGLAREVAAMNGSVELKALPEFRKSVGDGPEITVGAAAERYTLTELSLDMSKQTPDWLAARLRSAGMRPISLAVDITNYVMLEIGQPLHAFDADKVKLPVGVRYAAAGEKLKTLDGKLRKLTEQDLVIVDQSGPIALAGVMGGEATEVTDATRRIYLESAVFDAASIRKAAKRHNLRSEASARFERGLPVQLPLTGLARAVELFEELADAKVAGTTDQLNIWPWTQRIGLRASKLSSLMGYSLTAQDAVSALGRLGIEAAPFDIAAEARLHLGKPYKLGANFKQDGLGAFDCSYLTDYLYSLIGVPIGFTALGQYEIGRAVGDSELMIGDAVFYEGLIGDCATDHYFTREANGQYLKHEVVPAKKVGHVGLYVGNDRVIMAAKYEYRNGNWEPYENPSVVEVALSVFTKNPGYLGARRFVDNIDDYISVPRVPWWRPDLKLAEDLVEEIVRVLGYDKVPSTIPQWRPAKLSFDRELQALSRMRNLLSGCGLFEVMTYSFVGEDQLNRISADASSNLKLQNPLSTEQAFLRNGLLASHLGVLERNRLYAKEIGYYELSKVFVKREKLEQPDEPLLLGVTVSRPERSYAWAKGILDQLGVLCGLDFEIRRIESRPGFAKNRAGEIWLGEQSIGIIGQIEPKILREQKISSEMAYFEVDALALIKLAQVTPYTGKQKFPGAGRDISVVVDESLAWQEVRRAVEGLANATVEYVGEYYGDDIENGRKSLTVHLELNYPDHTPTDAEAAEAERRLTELLESKFRAKVRV